MLHSLNRSSNYGSTHDTLAFPENASCFAIWGGRAGPQVQERRLVSSGVEGPDVVVALQTHLWPKKGLLLFIYLFVCLAESGVSRGTWDLP